MISSANQRGNAPCQLSPLTFAAIGAATMANRAHAIMLYRLRQPQISLNLLSMTSALSSSSSS